MKSNTNLLELHPDAIAIVGMCGRFAGAADLAAFWEHLAAGRVARETYERDELIARGVAPGLVDDPAYVPAGMPMHGVAAFDSEFFGLSAKQADWMDPQIRLFLEVCWHAMEDAGYDVGRDRKSVV